MEFSPLLTTASELRSELEKAISRNNQLEELNANLATNFDTTQKQFIETKRKYNETRENYLKTQAEKDQILHDSHQQYETLLGRLDEKSKEFEQLREKLKPQDLDSIRLKVQEELEIPHRLKVNSIKTELEQQIANFHRMKRDMGNRIIELESSVVELQRDNEALKTERDAIVRTYKDQILKFHTQSPEKSEPERELLRKNHELKAYCDKVNEECRKLRQDRDETALLLEQTKTKNNEALVQLKTRLGSAEADRISATERVNRLTSEGDRKDQTIRSLKQSFEDLSAQVGSSERQKAELEIRISQMSDEHRKEMTHLRVQGDSEAQQAQRSSENLTERLRTREEAIRNLQREMSELQLRSEGVEAELNRSHLSQTQEASRRIMALESELTAAQNTLRLVESQKAQISQRSSAEVDLLKADSIRIKREKEHLHERVRELEGRGEGERRKHSNLVKDLTSKLSASEEACRESRHRAQDLDRSALALRREVDELRSALSDLGSKSVSSSQEHQEALDSARAEALGQIETLNNLFRERWDELKRKSVAALTKEREKCNIYKQKLLDIHRIRKIKAKLQREQDLIPNNFLAESDK